MLPLSITNILSFPYGHPVDAYVFSVVLPSLLSSKQWRILEDSSYGSCEQSN